MTPERELPAWPAWPRVDDLGLARYVTPQASRWLPLGLNRFDLADRPDRMRVIADGIYDGLRQRDIRYALEEYHPSEALQTIRTPAQVLDSPREGTCLDLATLYCGLCLAYQLLPILVVIEGHALAAVCTTHGLRDWDGYDRPGRELFTVGPLTDAVKLRELVDSEAYIAVECTGFAHSDLLGRRPDLPEFQHRSAGLLSFDQAVKLGRLQLQRPGHPLRFALDVAIAHYDWRVEPYPLEPMPGGSATNIFRLLAQAPALLARDLKVIDFERLVEENTRNFVGRGFIFEAVDRLLVDPAFPSGYVLIRGEPGIGKTALLSQLVKARGYVNHFNIALEGIRSTRTFLGNVCAQLIIRYQLDHATLPPEATEDSAFLSQLLAEATVKAGDQPVVVVVDALDEAEAESLAPTANRLYLPATLPDGVIFILTSREQMDYRLEVSHREDLYLSDDDPRNLEDVQTYVTNYIRAHPEFTSRVTAWQVTEAEFVDIITAQSQGNFMYLVHVLDDIRTGRISAETTNNVRNLPRGLRAYYQRLWRTMRTQDRDRFEQIYEPVLRILATVREPVAVAAIGDWTGIEPARILDVIRNWRPFLNEAQSEAADPRYRIYHASFQNFLAEEGGGLKPSHERIANAALTKIPGFFPSADGTAGTPGGVDGYAIRHLIAHLLAAGLDGELHRLLALSDEAGRNVWFAAKAAAGDLTGFMSDVAAARELLRRRADGRNGQAVREETRSSLTMSSVRSLTALVPAPMLKALLREGVWSAEAALGYVAHRADATSRAQAAIALLEAGPQWSWTDARRLAVEAIASMDISREFTIPAYATALRQLPAESPLRSENSIIQDLNEIAGLGSRERGVVTALADFAPLLSGSALAWAKMRTQTIAQPLLRAYALAAVAACRGPDSAHSLNEALASAINQEGNWGRAQAIRAFLRAGGDPDLVAADVDLALRLADAADDDPASVYAPLVHLSAPEDLERRLKRLLEYSDIFTSAFDEGLTELARRVAEPMASLLLNPSNVAEWEGKGRHYDWLLVASRVAGSLPEEKRLALARRFVEVLEPSDLISTLSHNLGGLGPLPPDLLGRALDVAGSVELESGSVRLKYRAAALGGLAACAPPPRRPEIAADALDIIADLDTTREVADALGRLAPVLDGAGLRRAARIAGTIRDQRASVGNLGALLPHLDREQKERALRMVFGVAASYQAAHGSYLGSMLGARLLRAVASELPTSLVAEAAMTARELSEPVWRGLALATLAPALPMEDRSSVLAEAWQNMPGDAKPTARAEVLAAFAAGTTGTERDQLVDATIAEIDRTESDSEMADAIEAVLPVLSDVQVAAAVDQCAARADRAERKEAIVARFAERLPLPFIERALPFIARPLYPLVQPTYPREMVPVLVRLAREGQGERARRLAQQWKLGTAALQILTADEVQEMLVGQMTDSMKASIAIRLAELGRVEAAHAALDQLSDTYETLRLCSHLAIFSSERLDGDDLPSLWERCLNEAAALPRIRVFEWIYALAPVAAAIAGPNGPNGLFEAIEQVLAWWP